MLNTETGLPLCAFCAFPSAVKNALNSRRTQRIYTKVAELVQVHGWP